MLQLSQITKTFAHLYSGNSNGCFFFFFLPFGSGLCLGTFRQLFQADVVSSQSACVIFLTFHAENYYYYIFFYVVYPSVLGALIEIYQLNLI